MRYYSYDEPTEDGGNRTITMSEDEIIESYWPWWYERMCEKYGKERVDLNYCKKDCINDWIIVHWARESI